MKTPAPVSAPDRRDWRLSLPAQKRIAIVGTAPDSMLLAPYADPSWQIWICNNMGMPGFVPRWDVCFDIHGHDFAAEMPEYYAWMQQSHGKPIFTRQQMPECPDSIAYPIEEMTAKFSRYFTSSVSYMLAMAVEFGAYEIGLYGVNMAHDSEYGHQRPSCEFFIGVAVGRQIKVTIPAQSDLLKTAYLYGIEDNSDLHAKWQGRYKEFEQRYQQHNQAASQHEKQSIFLKGALDDMRYWRQHFNFQDHTPAAVEK